MNIDYNKKFLEQLKKGEKYELELLKHIPHLKYQKMDGNFKPYDLKIYHKEKRYNTYEVKTDYQIHLYNNIAIEYECNNKPSGITTSTARYWAIFETFDEGYKLYIIPRKIIMKFIENKKFHKNVIGGDMNKSKLYLFNKQLFNEYIINKSFHTNNQYTFVQVVGF
jgi:hypothetical protein